MNNSLNHGNNSKGVNLMHNAIPANKYKSTLQGVHGMGQEAGGQRIGISEVGHSELSSANQHSAPAIGRLQTVGIWL